MIQWQVRAQSRAGAVVTFGLLAADCDDAQERALAVTPFAPCVLEVMALVAPSGRRARAGAGAAAEKRRDG